MLILYFRNCQNLNTCLENTMCMHMCIPMCALNRQLRCPLLKILDSFFFWFEMFFFFLTFIILMPFFFLILESLKCDLECYELHLSLNQLSIRKEQQSVSFSVQRWYILAGVSNSWTVNLCLVVGFHMGFWLKTTDLKHRVMMAYPQYFTDLFYAT